MWCDVSEQTMDLRISDWAKGNIDRTRIYAPKRVFIDETAAGENTLMASLRTAEFSNAPLGNCWGYMIIRFGVLRVSSVSFTYEHLISLQSLHYTI